MKRSARPGEPKLVHATTQTGDVRSVAICADNFDPAILAEMSVMRLGEAFFGYRLFTTPGSFAVIRDGDNETLSENTYVRDYDTGDVVLTTTVTGRMSLSESSMLADLEQCAALVLLDLGSVSA